MLVVSMDGYSRFVLSCGLSDTMDVGFFMETLEEAMVNAKPQIFKSEFVWLFGLDKGATSVWALVVLMIAVHYALGTVHLGEFGRGRMSMEHHLVRQDNP